MPRLKSAHISPTPEEDEEINRGIDLDPDAPEVDGEWFTRARPAIEVHPGLVEYSLRRRGTRKTPVKEQVSIRLDADVVARLRSSGPGWQTKLNEMLRRIVFGSQQ
jgi:uncharacterized protein (DUF4415 family)